MRFERTIVDKLRETLLDYIYYAGLVIAFSLLVAQLLPD